MASQETKIHTHKELEGFYGDDESCDKPVFSEMRSNILLVAGEHHTKRDGSAFKTIRSANNIPEEQRIRLTKNHIQKICKIYANHILSAAPGVGFKPKNKNELQDQKAAEMHHGVWRHLVEKHHLNEQQEDEVDNFIQIGEVATKIFYDLGAGPLAGYEALVGEDGQPVVDPASGQEIPDETKPVYKGEFVFEPIYGFNLLRPAECVDIRRAERLTIRKMVSKDILTKRFADKANIIKPGENETFMVFDPASSSYRSTKNEVLVKETYFRKCPQYPNGYYFIYTKEGELHKGELPGGLFPIVTQVFEKFQTTARGRSPIKIMRPYQVEINRAASKMAEHQITLGDDKVLLRNGSKVTPAAGMPGIRMASITGDEPVIMAGRDGSQYLNYMLSNIQELYEVMMAKEIDVDKESTLEPFVLLFQSASKKKQFQRYIKRFETYQIDKAKLSLSLAKIFMPDDEVIQAVGRSEQVNIKEFKNSNDLSYEIVIEAQSEDIETKLGSQLAINQVIQYVGSKLDKQDIGKLMRNMPYGNFENDFEDWTLDSDSARNLILALDRGEEPLINEYDDPVYFIKRLVSRRRQADFNSMNPQIQENYKFYTQKYQEIEVDKQLKLQRAQQGLIPMGGYLVTCDVYVSDPVDPSKTRRAKIPYESVEWLIQQLEVQGKTLADLEGLNQAAVAQMSDILQSKNQGGGAEGLAPASANASASGDASGKDSLYGSLSRLSGAGLGST